MEEEKLFYTLALQTVAGIGPVTAKRLIDYFESPKAIFQASQKEIMQVHQVGTVLWNKIHDPLVLQRAELELKAIQNQGLSICYYKDPHYPNLLRECDDSPIMLFHSNANFEFNNRRVISIIGTRNPSKRGVEFCEQLISDLKDYNPVIISGLAYGIDVCAHTAALEEGLDTYAVLGHGLNRIYPERHYSIARQIEEKGGSLISEFWMNSRVERENFIQRNRIVAGMSQAVIVIESAIKGGSMSTVTFANDYNRDVFAVPGRITDVMSQGCNLVIRNNRAQLLSSANDIVETLNWDQITKKPKVIQPMLFLDLSDDEQKVYDYLVTCERELLDMIALNCEMPIYKVSTTLLNLELRGIVRPLPGKYFELIQ